ncbi:MAG: hypothetical protein KGN33_08020 [Paracoccaceae bacterium]|nr:hypothetical protein [Paracoccaceae bacterium]
MQSRTIRKKGVLLLALGIMFGGAIATASASAFGGGQNCSLMGLTAPPPSGSDLFKDAKPIDFGHWDLKQALKNDRSGN